MYDDILNHVFGCLRDCVEVGIKEEPNRFRYLRYITHILDELELDATKIEEVFFEKIVKEFISYLAY